MEIRRWEYGLPEKRTLSAYKNSEDSVVQETSRAIFLEILEGSKSFSVGYIERAPDRADPSGWNTVTREYHRDRYFVGDEVGLRNDTNLPCSESDRPEFYRLISSVPRMVNASNEVNRIFWMMFKNALSSKDNWIRKWAPDQVTWINERLRNARKKKQEERRLKKETEVAKILCS